MLRGLISLVPCENYADVIPRIFIGNMFSARDAKFISENSINLIICASNDVRDVMNYGPNVTTVFLSDFEDVDYVNAGNIDATTFTNIFCALKKAEKAAAIVNSYYAGGGNILVHCAMGINRSALVIGLFMVKYLGYSYADAIKLLSAANTRRNPLFPVLTNRMFRCILASCV